MSMFRSRRPTSPTGETGGRQALVASYRSADTLIEFAERTDSGLAVRIPEGALLTPIDR